MPEIPPTQQLFAPARSAGIPIFYSTSETRAYAKPRAVTATQRRGVPADPAVYEIKAEFAPQPGDTVELKSRRTFFLDCPADYKAGDKVNIVLSLHGYGSYANWQRNYFPAMDVKDKYKPIVITPGTPTVGGPQ